MFILYAILALLSVGLAQSTSPTLSAPNNRFAAPNDFVTLVFNAEADEVLNIEAEARSSLGWQILRQPGTLTLEPGRSRPIAVTLAVPTDTPAFAENTVTLELRGDDFELNAQSVITVSEQSSLALEAPDTVVLGPEGFGVTLVNRGNVVSAVRLELRRQNKVIQVRERELVPQQKVEERLEVTREGTHTLVLVGGAEEVRKTLLVTRFGVPPPLPFILNAEASASLSNEGWQGELSADGALSDFTDLSTRIDAKDILSSYAALTSERWTAQLGGSPSDPYRLGLDAGTGVSGSYRAPRWSVAGAFGHAPAGVSGYAAGAYQSPTTFVAGGLGMRASGLQFSVSSEVDLEFLRLEADARYADTLNASLEVEKGLSSGSVRGQVEAHLLSDEAALSARLDYDGLGEALYISGTLPLSEGERAARKVWRVGLRDRFADASTLGELTLGLEVGNREGFAKLDYETSLAHGWQADAQLGVVYDEFGLGLGGATQWSKTDEDYYSLGGRLTYYPDTAYLDGQLDLKLQTTHAPFTFFGNSTWDLSRKSLGLNAGTVLHSGPWRVDVAGNASYGYGAVDTPFALGLTLSSSFSFDVGVPREVSEFAGGRRSGVVQGVVRSDVGPLSGVEVRVGRFRLLTDEAGRYRAEVEPGPYEVSLEVASLPITYRLIGEETRPVEVELKGEVVQDFRLARTAALRGRVLEDADADGIADTPQRGAAARLLLIDAEGLYRSLNTDPQGTFSARGLLPGEITLQLAQYPIGSVILGETTRKLTVQAGEVSEVTFLLQPARTRARSFGASSLRVRRVSPSAERVPPGAAPLVRVTVQGDADQVSAHTAAGSADLSLKGDVWLGYVDVPLDTPPGVFPFEVTAQRGDETASRRGQFVIDADIPLLEVTADGPVRAGESLNVSAIPLFEAAEVKVVSSLGNIELIEEEGQYAAQFPIADETEDAVYELFFRAVREDGTVVEQTSRVRVLNAP